MNASNDNDPALTKLKELRRKSFRDQAMWFLNASSAGENPEKCESVRRIERKCIEVESKSSDDGEKVLDEFTAHRLLEFSNNACSVPVFRSFVESIHGNKRRRVSLAELLIYVFNDDWRKLVDSPESYDLLAERHARDHMNELNMELKMLIDAAQDGARAAEEARQAENAAIEQEAAAANAADAARNAELSSRELLQKERDYLESLDKIQETNSRRKADLQEIVSNSSKGVVARNKANAELAILLSEDPLSLRTARIKQETATRKSAEAAFKSKEAMIHAESALHIARKARTEANKQREKAENAARAAHDAIIPAQLAFEKASNTLKEITKKHQGGRGTVFFLNADLNEQRRFLPKSQFVIAQKRAGDAIQSISSPSS